MSWWRMQRLRMQDSRRLRLLPTYRTLFGSTTLAYFRPGYSPADVGSTAQAVAYLAGSPRRPRRAPVNGAARAAPRRHGGHQHLWAVTGSLRRPLPPPTRDHTLTLRVAGREMVARDENVVALTLAAAACADLPPWHPGAHLDIHLPSGRVRQYSLCGDPAQRRCYRIAVRHYSRRGRRVRRGARRAARRLHRHHRRTA